MNYSEIKDLQTLEAARSQVSKELDSAYQGLLDRLNEARETYTPTGLLAEGTHAGVGEEADEDGGIPKDAGNQADL